MFDVPLPYDSVPGARPPARVTLAIASAATLLAPPVATAVQVPIAWQLGDFAGRPNQRIALTVGAKIDGHACPMQVDTGSNAAVRWRDNAGAGAGRKTVDVTVEFAGLRATVPTPPDKARQLARCGAGTPAGSLGNAFFDGGSLTIDLKTSRLRYAAGGVLAARLDAQPMFYARWTPQGGYPLVEIRKSGTLHGYAMVDTGGTAFGFMPAGKEQWDAATAGAPLRATDKVGSFTFPIGGRSLGCFVAPSAVTLQAGTWTLASPLVSYCPTLDVPVPLKLEGTLGLRGFGDSVITLDYVSGRWLVEKAR